MPDFYYIELYFSPDESSLADVVDGCVASLIESGCAFDKVIMPKPDFKYLSASGRHDVCGLDNLREVVTAYADEMEKNGLVFIAFPPRWGRISFQYDFEFDSEIQDEVDAEEEETGSMARNIGLSFMYITDRDMGRKYKANMCFWNEYILSHGRNETHVHNMKRILNFVEKISQTMKPYFGAMNDEIHLDPDKSLKMLKTGRLPTGNEFVFVGDKLLDGLNILELEKSGLKWKNLPEGVIIQFGDRWGGLSAV
jgi:hypothetical protein